MKFHLSTPTGNVVTAQGKGWVRIGAQEYRAPIVLTTDAVVEGFAPEGLDALTEADFAALLAHAPEIVLLGTGASLRFPHPRLTRALAEAGIGARGDGHGGRVPHVQHPRGRRAARSSRRSSSAEHLRCQTGV